MDLRSSSLLDEALGVDNQTGKWPRIVLVEDCVETSGAFVLNHLMKRALVPNSSNVVVFLAFSHPFSHYDRVLRKLGCNLSTQRDAGRLVFFDMLKSQWTDAKGLNVPDVGFVALYGKIEKVIYGLPEDQRKSVTLFIDDVSLMEVFASGSTNSVLDFLHYCHTLTSEVDCSMVLLNHMDVYLSSERPTFILRMEYLADVLIKAERLASGLASDVHGQLTVLNKGIDTVRPRSRNFQFKVKENVVEYFYPGSRN